MSVISPKTVCLKLLIDNQGTSRSVRQDEYDSKRWIVSPGTSGPFYLKETKDVPKGPFNVHSNIICCKGDAVDVYGSIEN